MMDSETNTNTTATKLALQKERDKTKKLKEKLSKQKVELIKEKERKQKLYKGLVKIASELKDTQQQFSRFNNGASIRSSATGTTFAATNATAEEKNWYEGGMWRGPELLPGIIQPSGERQLHTAAAAATATTSATDTTNTPNNNNNKQFPCLLRKEPVSLSDLFFDLIIVTAFTRVGLAIQDIGSLQLPQFFYFILFWLIWGKEASFSTRFDTTDLSLQMETLMTCFAVLFGSLSSKSSLDSGECTNIMIVACFIALLHFLLHLRVFYWFRDVSPVSELISVKDYAVYVMILTGFECLTWLFGICVLGQDSQYRWVVFLIAILSSFRLPRTFLPNDFHAACSKRGVLFILTLGFILQSIVLVASPFFDYQTPTLEQFFFLGLPCFLLFCIKLLYVDDSFSIEPKDHALLVNRVAGFFFHFGQLSLLLSTTILGGGLNLLTQNYLAGTAALPNNAHTLVCGGFSGVILSIGFIKSMHIRRFPTNPSHRQLFFAAYGTQIGVLLAVSYTTISLAMNNQVALSEIQVLGILCLLSLFLLIISWLDEAVELNLYGEADASEFRVHPFGLWACFKVGDPKPPIIRDTNTIADRRLNHLSPLLTTSNANLFDSQTFGDHERGGSPIDNFGGYGSLVNSESSEDGERTRLVKFVDDDNDGHGVEKDGNKAEFAV